MFTGMRRTSEQYPDLAIEIGSVVAELLSRGRQCTEALNIGFKTACEIRSLMGGSLVYLPKGHKEKLAERNQQIVRDYDGKNIHVLVKKYGLSNGAIYKILSYGTSTNKAAHKKSKL
jgi:Mor family transcriptional regulator